MQQRWLAGAGALAASLALIAPAAAAAHSVVPAKAKPVPARVTTHFYLALGDSLSVGYQPNRAGVGRETTQGYTDDLYAAARKRIKNLKLVELGCPGATTTSMLTGAGNAAAVRAFRCDQAGGSQLSAATAFLKAHSRPGEVPLITIDIGANDVDACASAGGLTAVETCVAKGVSTLETNLPKILRTLHGAAPRGARLAGMNLYDPILADELSSDPSQQSLGTLSLSLVKSINADIATADRANGFLTADTATAFGTYDTTPIPTAGTPLAATGATTVPQDVANICGLTWMCAAPPVGPNIHANATGYADIAKAFQAVLPKAF